VRLSDFGIARLFGSTGITNVGSVLGTAEFMAPEQAEGRPVDPRSDLYSLAAVFYVLLARRPLFRAKSLPEMLHKQRCEMPEPLRRFAPDCPVELEQIVSQLLEKDPARRIPNATLLGRRLAAMQHALSLPTEAAEAGDEAGSVDFDYSTPPAAGVRASPGELPPTRVLDKPLSLLPDSSPPLSCEPPPTPDELPQTKPSAAFQKLAEAAVPPKPAGHFVPVGKVELDPSVMQAEPARAVWPSAWTWALVGGLIGVAVVVWYLLQPPSADALYHRIVTRSDGTAASLLDVEGSIEEFLLQFPKDSRAAQLRQYQEEIELYRLERKFERQAKGRIETENLLPIERAYLEAINYLRLEPEQGRARLRAILDLYDQRGSVSGPIGQCLQLTRRRLEQVDQELGPAADDLRGTVEERLARADQLRQADPARAGAMYRAIITLYADKPWAAEAVGHARAALENDARPNNETPAPRNTPKATRSPREKNLSD
jgi:serine/threonine-protein kinase